jgi:Lrp/AsnC family transcriptional regulator, leucine-responsive regulatory protein
LLRKTLPQTGKRNLAFCTVNVYGIVDYLRVLGIERRKMKEKDLDSLDRAILGALLEDGRQSQVELAERVPLSATAIARRIRALEEAGVIEGYQARVSGKALGLSMTVIVHVSLNSQNQDLLKAFEDAVAKAPSVVSCHLMSGEDDYLIAVMARDLADYERIHKEQLSRLPGVARLKSSFVLRGIVNKPLPASCLLPSRK